MNLAAWGAMIAVAITPRLIMCRDDELAKMLFLVVEQFNKTVKVFSVHRSHHIVKNHDCIVVFVFFRQCEENAKAQGVQVRFTKKRLWCYIFFTVKIAAQME